MCFNKGRALAHVRGAAAAMAPPNLSLLSAEEQFAPLRPRSKIDAPWQRAVFQNVYNADGQIVARQLIKVAGWEDDDPTCPISFEPIIITGVKHKMYPFVHDPQNADNMQEALAHPSPQAWVATPCGHAILAWSFGEYVVSQLGVTKANLTAEDIRSNRLKDPVTRQLYTSCDGGWGDVAEQVALMCKNAVPPVEDDPLMPALPTLQAQAEPATIQDLLNQRSTVTIELFNTLSLAEKNKIERLMRQFDATARAFSSHSTYLAQVRSNPGLLRPEYVNSARDTIDALLRSLKTKELTFIKLVMKAIDAAVEKQNNDRRKIETNNDARIARLRQRAPQNHLTPPQKTQLKGLLKDASEEVTTTGDFVQVLETLRDQMRKIITRADEIQARISEWNANIPNNREAAIAALNLPVPPEEIGRLAAVGPHHSEFLGLTPDNYEMLSEAESGPFLQSVEEHVATLLQYADASNQIKSEVFKKSLSRLTRWFETKEVYAAPYGGRQVNKKDNRAYQDDRVNTAREQLALALSNPAAYGRQFVEKAQRAKDAAERKLAVAEREVLRAHGVAVPAT